jgi:UDPglucose--hexose-1-phosphate uridylyltransferase
MSEIRYDKLHDVHVIIASERLRRPDCLSAEESESNPDDCPFCEGHEGMTPPEIFAVRPASTPANTPGWQTRVVPNLYKAVQIESSYAHHLGIFEYWDGFGAHEVIIDTPYHSRSMSEWSVEDTFAWLRTLRQRVGDLRRDQRIAHLSLFKNEGMQAGATQPHSHTQLIGLPIVPRSEEERHRRTLHHYLTTQQALMETVLTHEIGSAERIVAQEGEFTAYCPYGSGYPFEIIISSVRSLGQIDTLRDSDLQSLASLLLLTLQKLKWQLGCLHFNLWIETPPLRPIVWENASIEVDAAYRFSMRIMPRVYRCGGFELSTGVMINPVEPELAAKLLREGKNV